MLSERIEHFRATWKQGSMSPLMYRDADEIITQLEARVAELEGDKQDAINRQLDCESQCATLKQENQRLREALENQLEKHKHWMHAPVTNDKETWCACFGCELAREALENAT